MIPTKLILLEGPPGSGKSTTAEKLTAEISAAGRACQCFVEWSPDNPIAIGDDLHLDQVVSTAIARENDVLQQWRQFARAQQARDILTVIESRFWQTSIMLMYAAGHPRQEVIESSRRTVDAIQGLSPVLIYFQIDHLGEFFERTVQIKEEEWRRAGFESSWAEHVFAAIASQKWFTSRGLSGLPGLTAFMEDWAALSEGLYEQLPFPKVKIRNPYQDWASAIGQIHAFLELA